MSAAAASFFPRESHERTLAGVLASSREQESRALWLEPHLFFFRDQMTRQWRAFSPLSGNGYSGSSGPCCQLWHSERALSMPTWTPAKVMELTCRLPTCRVQRSSLHGGSPCPPALVLARTSSMVCFRGESFPTLPPEVAALNSTAQELFLAQSTPETLAEVSRAIVTRDVLSEQNMW